MGHPNIKVNNAPHALQPVTGVATKAVTIAATAGTLETLGSFTFDASTRYVQVAIETAAVRVEPGGATPTTSVGQPVAAGQIVLLSIEEAKLAKWIRSTSTSATAQVSQYSY